MRDQDMFLEQALLEASAVTPEQMETARQDAVEHETSVVEALQTARVVSSRKVALVKADMCETPFIDLADYESAFSNTQYIPRALAERYLAYALFMVDGVLTVAMADPLNFEAVDQLRQVARCDVETVLAEPRKLSALINRAYSLSFGDENDDESDTTDAMDSLDASQPVVAAVNQILADAVERRASDVHINPDDRVLHLRFRIDGVLHVRQGPPQSMHAGIVQRLKVMANLDLTQTRRPQDGKFRLRQDGTDVDIRMSTVPTIYGENVVLRLLANTEAISDFQALGVPLDVSRKFEDLLMQPYGMLLVTGPTGSGKTTTLYTALSKLNDPCRNIMTIEDPVEIRLPYVRQIQVHAEIGLTFAAALRSILRQDPDVVLLGEIRDNETASIALQAALTGHLVLSTLHTNDAPGAIARLRDYGLPPFVINSAVLGVMAQRLVRRVCEHCTTRDEPTELLRHHFNLADDESCFVTGRGCARCSQSGYRGRVGLYELFRFTPAVQRMIEEGASVDRVRRGAIEEGMRLMWQDGLEKARLGQTTLEEISKVVSVVEIEKPTPQRRRLCA